MTALFAVLDRLPGMRLGPREQLDIIALAAAARLEGSGDAAVDRLASRIASLLAKSDDQWTVVMQACRDALAARAQSRTSSPPPPPLQPTIVSPRAARFEPTRSPRFWRTAAAGLVVAIIVSLGVFAVFTDRQPRRADIADTPTGVARSPDTPIESGTSRDRGEGAGPLTLSEIETAQLAIVAAARAEQVATLWQIARGLSQLGNLSRTPLATYKALQRHSGLSTAVPLDLNDIGIRTRLIAAVLAIEHPARRLPDEIVDAVVRRPLPTVVEASSRREAAYPPAPDAASAPGWRLFVAALALPLAAVGIWLWRLPGRRRRNAEDLFASGTGRSGPYVAARDVDPAPLIRQRRLLDAAGRQLDARSLIPTRALDVEATIDATIDRGGIFSPRFALRAECPEYLALILSHGPDDQEAARLSWVVDEMAGGMAGSAIDRRREGRLEKYFLEHDADRVFSAPGEKRIALAELAAARPRHRLLLLGTGEGLLDLADYQIKSWALALRHWPVRALATPVPPAEWGRREAQLSLLMEGPLFRTTTAGLTEMAEYLRQRLGEDGEAADYVAADRRAWRLDPHRFEAELPQDEDRNWAVLSEQLTHYLTRRGGEDMSGDDRGLRWLRALAVYPVLRWDLTSYLGLRLHAADSLGRMQPLYDEEVATRLSSLPWFRRGHIPKWVRRRLIAGLGEGERLEVVRAIGELLVSPPDAGAIGNSVRLPIADAVPSKSAANSSAGRRRPLDDFAANDGELLALVAAAPLGALVPVRDVSVSGRLSRLVRRFALGEWLTAGILAAYVAAVLALVPKPWAGAAVTGAWWPFAVLAAGLLLLPLAARLLRRALDDREG